jgi:hypothetical protein
MNPQSGECNRSKDAYKVGHRGRPQTGESPQKQQEKQNKTNDPGLGTLLQEAIVSPSRVAVRAGSWAQCLKSTDSYASSGTLAQHL